MRGIARAFARNPVFANIVLVIVFLGGFLAARSMTRETFPDFSLGQIEVTVIYPGADPSDVEEGVSLKIEEALEGVAGIKHLTTVSGEGYSRTTVEVTEDYDPRRVLDHVRTRVESIDSFPPDAEKPIINDRVRHDLVLLVALSADVPERRLVRLAEDLKAEILDLPDVSRVRIAGAREFEISVEVTEESLQAYEITLADISRAIRSSSFNLAGGTVRTQGEEIRLRTLGRKYTGEEFGQVVVRALPNGDVITLDHVADIRDGFTEDVFFATLDGAPAIFLLVSKTSQEDSIRITDQVKAFVDTRREQVPPGTRIGVMYDMSEYLRARIRLLLRNGAAGLALVFLLTWLFLDFRLSFWVGMGMPIAICGGLAVMWITGQTINMVSLFALIMVLGLIVDDAIVVGEAIYEQRSRGLPPLDAAIEGLAEVGWPVLAGVTTSIIAFLPLMFVSGVMGKFIGILPVVAIACFVFSLVEVLLLFPAHLRDVRDPNAPLEIRTPFMRRIHRVRWAVRAGLEWFTHQVYAPLLQWALAWRYPVICAGLAACLLLVGAIAGGILKFEIFGRVDGSILTATVELPSGTPLKVTEDAVKKVEQGIRQVAEQTHTRSGVPLVRHSLALTGGALDTSRKKGPHVGSVQVVLQDSAVRGIHSEEIMAAWEGAIGGIPGVESLTFENTEGRPVKRPIEVWFRGRNMNELLAAAEAFMDRLKTFDGVYQVERSYRRGKKEIQFELKPEARALGLTVADLASQLQARYYGHEAVRIQRGGDDVRVKVRYSAAERGQLSTLDDVRIRTPFGHEVPLFSVARASTAPAEVSILRIDGMRSVIVTAAVDSSVANSSAIVSALSRDYFTTLRAEYPDVRIALQGEKREMRESLASLKTGLPLAIVGIFVLIAAIFRSYLQPVVILIAVPLGVFGALISHMMLGLTVTMMSVFGMVALAGVAVNDAIIMIEAVNENLARGMPFGAAVCNGGVRRFRPVLLTTLTTVGGLTPLILETDFQARFLVPMAVSIAGGEAFGTILTVIVVPVSLYVLNDLRCAAVRLTQGYWPAREAVEPARHRHAESGQNAAAGVSGLAVSAASGTGGASLGAAGREEAP
ncbi:MAG: efflux RND transporter permease subunit [Gemmatimonadetes bacterium]|nr:efflux RND transporter permease subunit [Gemmatimonadota bacterium]